jgi:transcriptional regulator with XRE-family HTH domain
MEEDRRYAKVDGKIITQLRKAKGWSQPTLATRAGVHSDTIKRGEAEPEYRMQVRSIGAIAAALGIEPVKILVNNEPDHSVLGSMEGYTWDQIMAGAAEVGKEAFSEGGTFHADAVLAFPGASSIFAGLVLVTLQSPGNFLRVPVYTAIFKDKEVTGPFSGFQVAPTKCFNILVPEALLQDRTQRVVVIEDTIISGGAMDALREFFLQQGFGEDNIRFASCICHDSLAFGNRTAPEIIGLPHLEERRNFPMPWRIDSYRYEEVFCPDTTRGHSI